MTKQHRLAWLVMLTAGLSVSAATQEQPGLTATTGWICGVVIDESQGFVDAAEAKLFSVPPGEAPVAMMSSDPHGVFCFQDALGRPRVVTGVRW